MSESDQEYLGWRDGLPTAPDVEAICRQFPELKTGDEVSYQAIEELLRLTRGTGRWKSVTDAWRTRLREKGLVVECKASEAFYVATADQVSAATHSVLRGIGRKAKRHRQKIAVSRPEGDTQRAVLEHQARLMHGIERDAKKARMNLLPSTEGAQTPKITPPARLEKK